MEMNENLNGKKVAMFKPIGAMYERWIVVSPDGDTIYIGPDGGEMKKVNPGTIEYNMAKIALKRVRKV